MERTKAQRLFLIALFLFTIAGGLSDSIISNYFKGVFAVDAVQRGLLEIPRELTVYRVRNLREAIEMAF